MATFSEWTIEDAKKALECAVSDRISKQEFTASKAYVEDKDHYQDGDGWMGPGAGILDLATRKTVLDGTNNQNGVARQFTPVDVINEVLDRCANALMQREPDVAFVPIAPAAAGSEEEKAQIAAGDEMRRVVSQWWDRVKLWAHARAALKRSRWASRGDLRLWIPSGRLIPTKGADDVALTVLPTGLELADALARIEIDSPLPDAVAVYTDTATQEKVGIAQYCVRKDERDIQIIELWYIDGENTVIRVLRDDADDGTYSIKMGKRLPILEMQADMLITEPVKRQQARLNFVESILVRIAETAGFPERYTLNAAPNGIWMNYPPPVGTPLLEKREFDGVWWYLHAAPRTLGAAITTDLRGITTTDDAGKETLATPGVEFKEPTDPDFAIKSAEHARATILQQCKQAHVALEGTSQASGTAYQQARADFEADLNGAKGPLETLVRETIEAAIAMAEAMGTQSTFLAEYRCVVNLNVTSGPITPAEMAQNNENVKAGTLSAETAMARNGVEDVAAESDRMRNDPDAVITLRTKQIAAAQTLVAEGTSWKLAAQIAGVTDPDVLKLFEDADKETQVAKDQQAEQDRAIQEALNRGKAQPAPAPVAA